MSNKPSRDRIGMAAILVRNAGYEDVFKWMLSRDKATAHTPRATKQAEVVTRYGGKVKGGRPLKDNEQINLENKEIEYQDMGKLKGKLRF